MIELALCSSRQTLAIDEQLDALQRLRAVAVADASKSRHHALLGHPGALDLERARAGRVTERPIGANALWRRGVRVDQYVAADAVGPRDAAEKNADRLLRRSHGAHAAGLASPPSPAAAASRSWRFFRGLAFCGLLLVVRLARPALSRKRITRSVGCAPTESQCLARSTSSFTRSAWSFGSSGLWVPICSM